MSLLCPFVFFFFQAEDGIRDVAVTGVQTCALPIYRRQVCPGLRHPLRLRPGAASALPDDGAWRRVGHRVAAGARLCRIRERRVPPPTPLHSKKRPLPPPSAPPPPPPAPRRRSRARTPLSPPPQH